MRLLALLRLSVRPHVTTRLPIEGFSRNLVYEYFTKICRENSSVFELGLELRILYMITNKHFRSHLAQFFLK